MGESSMARPDWTGVRLYDIFGLIKLSFIS